MMAENKLINDPGLLLETEYFNVPVSDSLEEISNLNKTIREYRAYTNPLDPEVWQEYIFEIFHLFGFTTETIAPRLIGLRTSSSENPFKAIVCILNATENFDLIIPGLGWQSYVFFAAKYYKVDWAMITNGLIFKFMNNNKLQLKEQQNFIQIDFDEIINQQRNDSFFSFYKIFSYIKSIGENNISSLPKDSKNEKNDSDKEIIYVILNNFWTELIKRTQGRTQLFLNRKPSLRNFLTTTAGKTGFYWSYVINYEHARIELIIDTKEKNLNKMFFDQLENKKRAIEQAIGFPLVWDRLEDKRSSRIRLIIDGLGFSDEDQWAELQDKMIEAMIKFEYVFGPLIKEFN